MSAAPTPETLAKLLERIAELSDLEALQMLAHWDQLVMMPSEGGAARAQQLGTIARLAHERSTAVELGEWLAELDGAELGERERDVVRLARRDWERASTSANARLRATWFSHSLLCDSWIDIEVPVPRFVRARPGSIWRSYSACPYSCRELSSDSTSRSL